MATPTQLPVLNNYIKYYYQRDPFKKVPRLFAYKIINNFTIKVYFSLMIIDINIMNLFLGEIYGPLFFCNQLVITFGKQRKKNEFCNVSHVYEIDNTYF